MRLTAVPGARQSKPPGNHVFALGAAPEGNVWIGTSRGLAKIDNGRFVRYGKNEGLLTETIFAIEFGADQSTWFGGLDGITWFRNAPPEKASGG